jgi:ABC-type siderophore export system fused ATPase/permease subunit
MAKTYVQLYFQKGQREKIDLLIARLRERGVILEDNKGSPSVSALFRWLVDEKLAELGAAEHANDTENVEQ